MVYIDKTPYKLVDWIDINKLSWNDLNENPRSIHLLEQNKDKLCLRHLMHNINAIFIIEENLDKMNSWCWNLLSSNENAVDLLEQNLDNVNWWEISENPNAIKIIEENLDKVKNMMICRNPNAMHLLESENYYKNIENNWGWWGLCSNPSKECIKILEENINKEFFNTELISSELSKNPSAIHILEKYPEYINWSFLSSNPKAIHLLKNHLDKVNWFSISSNPNAVDIIKENLKKHKIDMAWLSKNPCIFEIDYDAIKEKTNIKVFEKELIEKCLHPKRFEYYLMKYNYNIVNEEDEDLFN